ncbi:hypothetical protein CPB84DRAFT_1826139 [Gymnopilus junonius]|uniref:Uncharacterized protein n=1 Tax=Gymnopilus junonius TaxID=109634 RepID=A0A9P5NL55_GYMJU|nr:hypothetical protein CPB84DRAFT_1826139 [Gymnopilus junonius]
MQLQIGNVKELFGRFERSEDRHQILLITLSRVSACSGARGRSYRLQDVLVSLVNVLVQTYDLRFTIYDKLDSGRCVKGKRKRRWKPIERYRNPGTQREESQGGVRKWKRGKKDKVAVLSVRRSLGSYRGSKIASKLKGRSQYSQETPNIQEAYTAQHKVKIVGDKDGEKRKRKRKKESSCVLGGVCRKKDRQTDRERS